jgi:hypothetical protein
MASGLVNSLLSGQSFAPDFYGTAFNSSSGNIPWLKQYMRTSPLLNSGANAIDSSIPNYFNAAKTSVGFNPVDYSSPLTAAATGTIRAPGQSNLLGQYGLYNAQDALDYLGASADVTNQAALKYAPAWLANINAAKAADLGFQLQGDILSPTRQVARNVATTGAVATSAEGTAALNKSIAEQLLAGVAAAKLGTDPRRLA